MGVQDKRLPPFVWQGRRAMVRIRSSFEGQALTTAIAVYQSMTQLANDARGLEFEATRKDISDLAGCSDRTLDACVTKLEGIGVVEIERTGGRKPNRYVLLELVNGETTSGFQRNEFAVGDANSETASGSVTKKGTEEEGKEETTATTSAADGQLFAADPSPSSPAPVSAPDPINAAADRLWDHWLGHFKDRHRLLTLSPARRAMFVKGLNAVGAKDDLATAEQICLDAIDGFKSWVDEHPRATVDPSKVFQTKPGGKNMTDQVESWSLRVQEKRATSGGSANLVDHHPLIRDKVRRYRIQVVQMYQSPELESAQERGQAALTWLREQAQEEPVIEDGRVKTWRKIEA